MMSKDITNAPFDTARIKRVLKSSLAKCFYFSFSFNAVIALLSSIRNNTADDPTTIFAVIGLAIHYFVSPFIMFIYGAMRQRKYKEGYRMLLSGAIVALATALVYPIFLWLGIGALPIQGNFIYELVQMSMAEYIPVKQLIAFLLSSVLMKFILYIIQNKKGK